MLFCTTGSRHAPQTASLRSLPCGDGMAIGSASCCQHGEHLLLLDVWWVVQPPLRQMVGQDKPDQFYSNYHSLLSLKIIMIFSAWYPLASNTVYRGEKVSLLQIWHLWVADRVVDSLGNSQQVGGRGRSSTLNSVFAVPRRVGKTPPLWESQYITIKSSESLSIFQLSQWTGLQRRDDIGWNSNSWNMILEV